MKKIYIPSEEELQKIQFYNGNIYKYLTVKAIEGILMDGIKFPPKGRLKGQFSYVKENPEITRGVCLLYPEELVYAPFTRLDFDLCKDIIYAEHKSENLDNIKFFDNAILDNHLIIGYVIDKLYEILKTNPRYRYDYENDNKLLDDIFNRKIALSKIHMNDILKKLFSIEPAYVIMLDNKIPFGIIESFLADAIDEYAARYHVMKSLGTEYIGKDILTNKDKNVKRLIRVMKQD